MGQAPIANPNASRNPVWNGRAIRAGKKPNGGIARAPTAPAATAIRRRGQPQARMTVEASEANIPARVRDGNADEDKGAASVEANQRRKA